MSKSSFAVKDISLVAVFAAICAVCSQIAFPSPSGVSLTLQTFAVALCGCFLGLKRGCAAVAVYIIIGAVGAPVFACFSGGAGVIFGKSGGFLWGFIFLAVFSALAQKFNNYFVKAGLLLTGLLICHLCGISQFSLITGTGFIPSFLLVSMPYLIKDFVSLTVAYFVALRLKKALKTVM